MIHQPRIQPLPADGAGHARRTNCSLRVEYDTDVFDATTIEALIERLRAGAGGHDHRSGADRCRRSMLLDADEHGPAR